MQTKPVLLIFRVQLYNESSKNVKVNSLKIGHSMILMRHSKLEEDKGFSKVKSIYIVFRMCACEGKLLCQFCAISLQKQAILGGMWQ